MSQSNNGVLKSFFGGLLIGGLGLALLYFWAWPSLQEARASDEWTKTVGKINSSKIETERDSDGKKTFHIKIDYEYVVLGKTFTGSRIRISDLSIKSAAKAKSKLQKYTQGKEVNVYYDPVLPDSCALETGAGWDSYLFVAVFGLFTLLGLFAILTAIFKIFILIFVLIFKNREIRNI